MTAEGPALGALCGALVGDALGRPFEGISRMDAPRAVASLNQPPRTLGYSDDGEMTLLLWRSLTEHGGFVPDHFARLLAAEHDPARGYGRGTRAVLRAIAEGVPWRDASRSMWPEGSRGNGAAARVAPVAVWYREQTCKAVAAVARASAGVTHAHPEAMDGAAIVAVAVHAALCGLGPHEAHDVVLHEAGTLRRDLERMLASDDPPARPGLLARESVPAAIWAARRSGRFRDAMTNALALGGDTDTVMAMTGAVVGARVGVEGIPREWLDALEPTSGLVREGSSRRALR